MTDLQRLHDWCEAELGRAQAWLNDPYAGNDARATYREAIENHAETARILSVLLRVREGHKWTTGETDGSQYIGDCYMHIKCTPDTLRDLAELLGGGK